MELELLSDFCILIEEKLLIRCLTNLIITKFKANNKYIIPNITFFAIIK